MLSRGNTKLGAEIWAFSIPASADVCVGATEACSSVCYAQRGRIVMPACRSAHEKNLEATLTDTFPDDIVALVRIHQIKLFRVHVAGDYYSPEYVEKWRQIAERCPGTVFLAYTRSWRKFALVPALMKLAALPNVRLWLSADRDSGEPPMRGFPFAGVAYLMLSDRDRPRWRPDLVFRDRDHHEMKFVTTVYGDALVCPYEQGVERKVGMTCSRCRFCFSRQHARRWGRSGLLRTSWLPHATRLVPGSDAASRERGRRVRLPVCP